jgi:N,N'-diacetyllegionaminate synthase
MKIGSFDTEKEVFIVAEVGNNHEGSYTLAEELVGLAAEAGAHAIKFQTFKTELYISPKDEGRFKRMKGFELSQNEFEKLSQIATKAGLIFFSTPFDLESAAFLRKIVSVYKVASGDNNFYPLLEFIAKTSKPILVSSGMSDLKLLQKSKAVIEKIWAENNIHQELGILHCVSSYPVEPDQANLGAISHLKNEFKCTIGYSDHTIGTAAAVMAVTLGARIIEKHFTIRKDYSDFRDHQLSADPKEMAELVRRIRLTSTMLGSGLKTIQPCERDGVKLYRRSIVAKRDLPVGEKIVLDNIMWIRPASGLVPGQEDLVVGKTLKKALKAGDLVLEEDLR